MVQQAASRVPATRAAQPAQPTAQPGAEAPGAVYGMGNSSASRAKAVAEVEKQREAAQRRAAGVVDPFRFWLRDGESADLVILDVNLDSVFFGNEHQIQGADGKWSVHELCPKEHEACTLCSNKESYYFMGITVIDWRGYQNKQGIQVPHSKKLLCVKAGGMDDYFRLHDVIINQHGTMRGAHILVKREGSQSLSIGHPIMFDTGEMFEMFDEATLVTTFGHPALAGTDGRLIKAENADITPFPYAQIFPLPSGASLQAKYGGVATAGSPQANQAPWTPPQPQAAPSPAAPSPVAQPVPQQPSQGEGPPVGEPEVQPVADTQVTQPVAQPQIEASPAAAPPMTAQEPAAQPPITARKRARPGGGKPSF